MRMALEYRALRAGLERIERLDELSGDPVRDRLTALAREMAQAPSGSTRDLVSKTEVLMDWLDPNGSGVVAAELTASLCRDILLLFPAEPQRVLPAER
jgi:hypothetical protein